MSKKNEELENDTAVLENQSNQVELATENGTMSELLNSKKRAGYSLSSEYLKMEKDESMRFAVVSKSTMEVPDEEGEGKEKGNTRLIPTLIMVDENGSTKTAGQTVLVNSISGSVPCYVEIVCRGSVKLTGGRTYTDFDVFPLND